MQVMLKLAVVGALSLPLLSQALPSRTVTVPALSPRGVPVTTVDSVQVFLTADTAFSALGPASAEGWRLRATAPSLAPYNPSGASFTFYARSLQSDSTLVFIAVRNADSRCWSATASKTPRGMEQTQGVGTFSGSTCN